MYGFPGILELKFRFFPGNFCQNFWFSRKSGVDLFTNSREFWSTKPRKMQEYTGFPEFSSEKSDFSREIFTKIWNFHDISGRPTTKFPGILVEKTPAKCRNMRVSRVSGGKNHNFPGNFRRPVDRSRKNVVIPQACTFKNIRVSRSPQAHILGPEKDPQKFICT